MAGLSPEGFTIKSYDEIFNEIVSDIESNVGPIDSNPNGLIGQIIGIFSQKQLDLWQLSLAVYNMFNPDAAEGVQLDGVAAITGITRLAATKTFGNVQCYGQQGTILPVGRVVSILETGARFVSTEEVTITRSNAVFLLITIAAVQNSTDYTVTINGVDYTYTSDSDATAEEITQGLDSALSSAPVDVVENSGVSIELTSSNIDNSYDFSVTANLSIDDVGVNMPVESEIAGSVIGLAGTINIIETPVSGWLSVDNENDLAVGRDRETDAQLRLRRDLSLSTSAAATIPAIRKELGNVPGVTGVSVTENPNNFVDAAGRPPHSVECVVAGATDLDIANKLWQVHGAGIRTFGNTTVVIQDEEGNDQVVQFSRALPVYIWVRVTINDFYNEEEFPENGEQLIIEKVVSFGNNLEVGEDVIPQRFYCVIYEVPGISDVTVELATSATPAGPPGSYQTTPLTIPPSSKANFNSDRTSVVLP